MYLEYDDNPGHGKRRPVVIIDATDPQNPIMVPISSVGPKTPPVAEDAYKLPIGQWAAAGLAKPSWTRNHLARVIPATSLIVKIGELDPADLNRTIAMVNSIGKHSIIP